MKNLTQDQKDTIQKNTIKDSGVICWEEYHSKDEEVVVTNVNINKQPGFYADRVYTLKNKGEIVLRSKDHGAILDEYVKIMLEKLKL
jgi:hypothetical protein